MSPLLGEPEPIRPAGRGLALKLIATYVAVALVPLIMSGYVTVALVAQFSAESSQGPPTAEQLDRYVHTAIGITLMVGFFGVLVGGAMSVLFAGWILGPLKRVNRFLAQVSRDRDFYARLDLPQRDEIGQVAGGVNRLLDAVLEPPTGSGTVCGQCGAGCGASDRYCRRCGHTLPRQA